jgi:hypothetical protein
MPGTCHIPANLHLLADKIHGFRWRDLCLGNDGLAEQSQANPRQSISDYGELWLHEMFTAFIVTSLHTSSCIPSSEL